MIAAAIALVLAVATTITVVDIPSKQLISGRDSALEAVPALPQAAWKIRVHASGVGAKVSPAAKKSLDRQGPRLRSLVKKVYDSLFVHPNRLPGTLRQNFSGSAAAAFRRAGAGASEAGRASTTLRRARIGIEAERARAAVAAVTVRAVGDNAGAAPVLHRSTLWLERARTGWKVVAFDVRQGAVPKAPAARGKRRAGSKAKKGRG